LERRNPGTLAGNELAASLFTRRWPPFPQAKAPGARTDELNRKMAGNRVGMKRENRDWESMRPV